MKVKDLVTEVDQEILDRKKARIKEILKTKKRELDGIRKVMDAAQADYDKLLDQDVEDFVFEHDYSTPFNNVISRPICGNMIESSIHDGDMIVRLK